MGAARFAFADLCEEPLGARDYLRLAHAYDTVMIDGVPQLDRTRSDAAKRFILLIDTLYDRGVKLERQLSRCRSSSWARTAARRPSSRAASPG